MSRLSLVDQSRIAKDPRKLAYLYPRMPVGRYKQQVDDYYRNVTVKAVEEVAAMLGVSIVPASCVHHRRRESDKRIMLLGKAYYIKSLDEMTELELEKYQSACIAEGE